MIFAIARFCAPAFTILLSVVPATAALEAFNIVAGAGNPPGSYLPIVAPSPQVSSCSCSPHAAGCASGTASATDSPHDQSSRYAVDAAIRQAVHNHVEQAGASGDDIIDASMQQCSGEQQ